MKAIEVIGFDGKYLLSKDGSLYNKRFGKYKEVNYFMGKNGYKLVALYLNSKIHHWSIHRLLATHFIPNPNNYPQVNHKDGNKTNNSLNNLEWVTVSSNVKHAIKLGLFKPYFKKGSSYRKGVRVCQYDLKGNLIRKSASIIELSKYGYSQSAISRVCSGRGKTHKGFIFKYEIK